MTIREKAYAKLNLSLDVTARRDDGSRILPTLWSDNYIHLMPGETRELEYRVPDDEPEVVIEVRGFNTKPLKVSCN